MIKLFLASSCCEILDLMKIMQRQTECDKARICLPKGQENQSALPASLRVDQLGVTIILGIVVNNPGDFIDLGPDSLHELRVRNCKQCVDICNQLAVSNLLDSGCDFLGFVL